MPTKSAFSSFFFSVMLLVGYISFTQAASISVTPKIGITLPSLIAKGDVLYALYTVKNTTNQTLQGIKVSNLPTSISQVTTDTTYCPATINLGPLASCTLKLSIKAASTTSFKLCIGNSCFLPSKQLAIKWHPLIAPGFYSDGSTKRPLLAVSNNLGNAWKFPSTITNPTLTPAFAADGRSGIPSTRNGLPKPHNNYILIIH